MKKATTSALILLEVYYARQTKHFFGLLCDSCNPVQSETVGGVGQNLPRKFVAILMYKSWHCARRVWGGEFVPGAALLLGENHTFPILELTHRHRVNRRQNCPREIELIREFLCDGMLRITDRDLPVLSSP